CRAAEEAAHEIDVDLLHQLDPARLGNGAHGEAAGDVNRGPERRNAGEQPGDRLLVGKVDGTNHLHLLVLAIREALRLLLVQPRPGAAGTRLDKGPYDGRAKRACAARHHDIPTNVIHLGLSVRIRRNDASTPPHSAKKSPARGRALGKFKVWTTR